MMKLDPCGGRDGRRWGQSLTGAVDPSSRARNTGRPRVARTACCQQDPAGSAGCERGAGGCASMNALQGTAGAMGGQKEERDVGADLQHSYCKGQQQN